VTRDVDDSVVEKSLTADDGERAIACAPAKPPLLLKGLSATEIHTDRKRTPMR